LENLQFKGKVLKAKKDRWGKKEDAEVEKLKYSRGRGDP